MPLTVRLPAATAAAVLLVTPAGAHPFHLEQVPLVAGMLHPLSGADHLIAMIAVGAWAALLTGRALWLVPTAFIGAMLAGFGAAQSGIALPYVEPMILASVIALCLFAALAIDVPVLAAAALVAIFAVFHGHAHGSEMTGQGALGYASGFALSTVALHAVGALAAVGLLRAFGAVHGRAAVRVLGLAGAAGGLALAAS